MTVKLDALRVVIHSTGTDYRMPLDLEVQAMAWIQHGRKRFASKRKTIEYLKRLQMEHLGNTPSSFGRFNGLLDDHITQLNHGCTDVKTPHGRTYTAGHKVLTEEFRGH